MYKYTIFALVATALFCLVAAAPQNPFWPEEICQEGEVKRNCGKRCEDKCNEKTPDFCKGIFCDPPTCGCRNELKRDPISGKCVEPSQCPKN